MTRVQWRVPGRVPAGKLIIAGVLVLLAVLVAAEWWQLAVALVAAAGMAGWAARDLMAPVRLAADSDGLTVVTGFARRVRVPWSQIRRVRVDTRRRSRMLEVDVDETLYLLSRYELDADLDDVVAHLEQLRPTPPPIKD